MNIHDQPQFNAEYGFMVAIMAFKKFKKPIEVEQMIFKKSMKSYSQIEDLCALSNLFF